MITIVDYGVGNIFSLYSSFGFIGEEVELTGDIKKIRNAEKLILPGVGAFGDAMDRLTASGLADVLVEKANEGTCLLGICLGMQLLFEKSYEYGEHKGLGLIKGNVVSMEGKIPNNLKIPHIGWNQLRFQKGRERSPLFRYIKDGDFVYFVHSYYGADCTESVIADTEYGSYLTAAVQKANVYGVQFHPEKSGDVGMRILKGFSEL